MKHSQYDFEEMLDRHFVLLSKVGSKDLPAVHILLERNVG